MEGIDSADDEDYLVKTQSEGMCCGLGPPLQCLDHTVDKASCGLEALWYPARGCRQVSNPNVSPPVFGGCPYDMPAGGKCGNKKIVSETMGCAFYLEQVLSSALSSHGYVVIGASFIHFFIGVFLSCCFMGKRKIDDVLPECMLIHQTHKAAIVMQAQPDDDRAIVLTELKNIQTHDDSMHEKT
jgi:hypothetical protein